LLKLTTVWSPPTLFFTKKRGGDLNTAKEKKKSAEGCFHVSVVNKVDIKVGKSVRVLFQISLHRKDKALLDQIKDFFGMGVVIDRNDGAFYYKVSQIKDLMLIINHFDMYPLLLFFFFFCLVFFCYLSQINNKKKTRSTTNMAKEKKKKEKRADFELFKQIIDIISRKEHLSEKGLQKIVNIKASMNFEKLSDNLKA